MPHPIRARRRTTDTLRDAARLAHSLAISLGEAVRSGRRRLRMTQAALALRVGVDQSRISQIERGLGRGVSLDLWVALGVALGRPLAIGLSRPMGEQREQADTGHLAMQEQLLSMARATGRMAMFEVPTRPADPRHSIDVCVRDDRNRLLIIEEAWNTFGDLGAAVRSTKRKLAEAEQLAFVSGGKPYRAVAVWVVRSSAANRALMSRYPLIFGSAFPGSSREWAAAIRTGARPPIEAGLVWLDTAQGRVSEWRKRGVGVNASLQRR